MALESTGAKVTELAKKPSEDREEGELSSAENVDDDDNNSIEGVCAPQENNKPSTPQYTTANASSTVSVPVPSEYMCPQDFKPVKAATGNSPPTSIAIQSRPSMQSIIQKSIDNNHVPMKTSTPGWCSSSGATDNLVIRFSDDDSGSDSEECMKEKVSKTKTNTIGVASNRKPPALSYPTSLLSKFDKQISTTATKTLSKKLFSDRPFNSTTKFRGPNFRTFETSSLEQGTRTIKYNAANKKLDRRERYYNQDVSVKNSKLQDLRQQIALKESALKLKSIQQSKESVSFREDISGSIHNDVRKRIVTCAESVQTEPEEPNNKRLKTNGSYSYELNSVRPQLAPVKKSTLPSKVPELENSIMQNVMKIHHAYKGKPVSRAELSTFKGHKRGDNQVVGVSGDRSVGIEDGAALLTNCIGSESSKQMHPSSMLNQALSPANIDTNIHAENLASLRSESLWNCMGTSFSGLSSINLQSLVEMDESLDKDLEDAQEHRHRCEIEERHALKAYRKAQRALVEANARCTELYCKRELYSAHLHSLTMENPSLLSSSRELYGLPGFNSNIQCLNSAPVDAFYENASGQNLGSEPCSEPDASTSELLYQRAKTAARGIRSPSNDLNISADEDEDTFPFDHRSLQPNSEVHIKGRLFEDGRKGIIEESSRRLATDSTQDTLHLEEKLRSELFARLGERKLSKNSSSYCNGEPALECGAENDVRVEKNQKDMESVPFLGDLKSQQTNHEGSGRQEGSNSEVPSGIIKSLSDNSEDDKSANRDGHCSFSPETFMSPNILKSAICHLKIMSPISLIELWARNRKVSTCESHDKGGASVNSDSILWSHTKADSLLETVGEFNRDEPGSSVFSASVDPFWPLCLFELRGKCNNDECPWQHVKDHCNATLSQNKHNGSDDADRLVGLTLRQKACNGSIARSKFENATTCPKYHVGLDILKGDVQSCRSIISRRNSECWQKCFSRFLALSSSFQKDLPADAPFLLGTDGRIKVQGSWIRQSSYFLSNNGRVNQSRQNVSDNEQAAEIAILICNQEIDKHEGMRKALPVLARALEDDPTSAILWILYLFVYHSNMTSMGKDDLFSCAVKHCEGSYELWLMFINSRVHLDDRLAAYDAALAALFHHASSSNWDLKHASACILDLFLQMVDCLRMSGNVEKAINRIFGLYSCNSSSDESSLQFCDIPTCLTISDKCMFWISCVYLVIYRKLPDSIVQQFECEKQLCEIEWPSIHLINDEKQRAISLMERGVHFIDSWMKKESCKIDEDLMSAHFFSLNHIRCMATLDSLECCGNLLDKYLGLYPSCLELVLLSARVQKQDFGDLSFEGFEEALTRWPKEVPGIQCIWNQYAEYVLHNGRYDFGKELMDRWFHSVWKAQYLEKGALNCNDNGYAGTLLGSGSDSNLNPLNSNLYQVDIMFGYLNLSLHKLLQNDLVEARLAVDKALKSAIPKYLNHCIREHAMFLLTDDSLLKASTPTIDVQDILEGYIGASYSSLIIEPLPRKFINDIKKPRVRQLVTNIFSSVSYEFSLINSVLEVWNGLPLLLEKFSEPKYLVDIAEAILDICPSNYPLAISVCKMLCRQNTSTSILFWACFNMVNAICHAIPVPPEYLWVDVAGILCNITGIGVISERFFKKALSIFPLSIELLNSYYRHSMTTGNMDCVLEAAKEKGIDLH